MFRTLKDIAKQLQRIADTLELIAKNQKVKDFEKIQGSLKKREPRQHY